MEARTDDGLVYEPSRINTHWNRGEWRKEYSRIVTFHRARMAEFERSVRNIPPLFFSISSSLVGSPLVNLI